jgi:crossover junction endodeoxyribonuclease RusA
MKVIYPYPPNALSPNARAHWSEIAKHKKQVRADANYMTRINQVRVDPEKPVMLAITFRPSTKAAYDIDNAFARCKALIDGIADALKVDDRHFTYQLARGEPMKGGAVEITFSQ